jgi:hypothetical protein
MRRSLNLLAALAVVFLFLGCAQNVLASSVTFDFSFTGTGITASGTLTATLVSGSEYLVTSISGMQNGASMTLLAPGTFGGNDNEIFSTKPFVDESGVGFTLSGGTINYNVYYDPITATSMECNSSQGTCSALGSGVAIRGTLTEVPEPASLMLFGSGLLGLAGVARRKLFA